MNLEKRKKIYYFTKAIIIGVFIFILIILLKIKHFNKIIFFNLTVSMIAIQIILEIVLEYSPDFKFLNTKISKKKKIAMLIVVFLIWAILVYYVYSFRGGIV